MLSVASAETRRGGGSRVVGALSPFQRWTIPRGSRVNRRGSVLFLFRGSGSRFPTVGTVFSTGPRNGADSDDRGVKSTYFKSRKRFFFCWCFNRARSSGCSYVDRHFVCVRVECRPRAPRTYRVRFGIISAAIFRFSAPVSCRFSRKTCRVDGCSFRDPQISLCPLCFAFDIPLTCSVLRT